MNSSRLLHLRAEVAVRLEDLGRVPVRHLAPVDQAVRLVQRGDRLGG